MTVTSCVPAPHPTVVSWSSSSSRNHPFWVGTQAHPEFKSRPERPAPLFREFVAAALARSEGRNPHLPGSRCRSDECEHIAIVSGSFRFLGEDPIFDGYIIKVRNGRFEAPDGTEFQRDIVRHPGAVSVVPYHGDGTVTMVRQYRAALDTLLLEIPAGERDVADEPPVLTGATASSLRRSACGRGAWSRSWSSSTRRDSPMSTPMCSSGPS